MSRRSGAADGLPNKEVRCPWAGKVMHMTRELAKEKLRRMRLSFRNHGRSQPWLRVYQCRTCQLWHIGGRP